MGEPLFSVVMPAFNDARYIRAALRSILDQEIDIPYEVVVVDDGSTDGTAQILAEFGEPVRAISKANGGPGSARNAGVIAARSDLILFLDADDLALPGRFAAQVPFMRENAFVDVSFGNWIVEGQAGNYLARYGLNSSMSSFTEVSQPLQRLLVRGSFVPTSTAAVRRKAYIAAGMQPERIRYAEDLALWCNIAGMGGRFAYSGSALAWYRTRSDGRLTQSEHTYDGLVHVLQAALAAHGDQLSAEEFRQASARFRQAAAIMLRHHWTSAGRRAMLDRAASLGPLLPSIDRLKWGALSLIPSVFPRALRSLRRRMSPGSRPRAARPA